MTSDTQDPLDQAIDWLLRVQERPEDSQLLAELEGWLAADERHRSAYRKAERVWQLSAQLPAPERAPVSSAGRLAPPLKPPAHAGSRKRRWLRTVGAIAACCLIVLLHQPLYLAWRSDYQTSVGERQVVRLPDGSTLTLDAQSAVALDFHQGRRHVSLLQGQAYFAVKPDRSRPFQVEAGPLTITVTGTAFNVDLIHNRVNVTEGSVQVVSSGGEQRQLIAGQGVRMEQRDLLASADVQPSQVAAWRTGRLIVRAQPIAEVLELLAPYLGERLVINDAELARQPITGVYNLDDPHAALRAVIAPLGGRVVRLGPVLTVISRVDPT
jgi:transmembrane sensor